MNSKKSSVDFRINTEELVKSIMENITKEEINQIIDELLDSQKVLRKDVEYIQIWLNITPVNHTQYEYKCNQLKEYIKREELCRSLLVKFAKELSNEQD